MERRDDVGLSRNSFRIGITGTNLARCLQPPFGWDQVGAVTALNNSVAS
jgi:hypothetical protein